MIDPHSESVLIVAAWAREAMQRAIGNMQRGQLGECFDDYYIPPHNGSDNVSAVPERQD